MNPTARRPSPQRRNVPVAVLHLLMLCMLATCVSAQAAEVYRWKDAHGVTHYSDSKPREQPAETVRVDTRVPDAGAPVATSAQPSDAAETLAARPQPAIFMYTNPKCGFCRKADSYFAANRLVYQSLDITASAQNLKKFHNDGGRGTPLIFVGGQRVSGFNKQRLDALIFGGQ